MDPSPNPGAVVTCRLQAIELTVAAGRRRSPAVPRRKFAPPPGSCALILRDRRTTESEAAAAAMSPGPAPPAIAMGSASRSALR